MIEKKFSFLKPTRIFSLVGIFIPGFTAFAPLELQILLSNMGIECAEAWMIIVNITTICAVLLPLLFFLYIRYRNVQIGQSILTTLLSFNLLEYIFIQASFSQFFTTGKQLCYVSDGQNGLELVFTAWLSLPILILLSYLFDKALNKVIN